MHPPWFRATTLTVARPPAAPTTTGGGLWGNRIRGVGRTLSRYLPPSKGRREEVERFAGESHQLPIVGNGYGYEAMEVVRCLREGRLESPIMPLDETRAIMETMDRLRAAWGVHLSKEPPWPTFTNPERRV